MTGVQTCALPISDSETRRLAVQSLASYPESRVVYLIASLLDDSDIRVRYAAIAALGVHGGKRATSILQRLTHGKSVFIREKALEALQYCTKSIFQKTAG